MISIKTFGDLLMRPILEAYITQERKRLRGQDIAVPKFTRVGRGEGRASHTESDILNLPEVEMFEKHPEYQDIYRKGPSGQHYGSSTQHPQYIAFQLLLKLMGLADEITSRDRLLTGKKDNTRVIESIKTLAERVFEQINKGILSPSDPAKKLWDLLHKNYNDRGSELYFADYMRYKKDWSELISPKSLQNLIFKSVSERVHTKYHQKQTSADLSKQLDMGLDPDINSDSDIASQAFQGARYTNTLIAQRDQNAKKSEDVTLADIAAGGRSKSDLYQDRQKFISGLSSEEKKRRDAFRKQLEDEAEAKKVELTDEEQKEIIKQVRIEFNKIFPYFIKLSKVFDSPNEAFEFDKKISRLAGALFDTEKSYIYYYISNELRKPELKIDKLDVDDLEKIILKSIDNAVVPPTEGPKTTQITNVYAKEAARRLRQLTAYFIKKKGWTDGFTLENVFKWIKTDNTKEAEAVRNSLSENFGISTDELTTGPDGNFKNFDDFVNKLYAKNKQFVAEYKSAMDPPGKWIGDEDSAKFEVQSPGAQKLEKEYINSGKALSIVKKINKFFIKEQNINPNLTIRDLIPALVNSNSEEADEIFKDMSEFGITRNAIQENPDKFKDFSSLTTALYELDLKDSKFDSKFVPKTERCYFDVERGLIVKVPIIGLSGQRVRQLEDKIRVALNRDYTPYKNAKIRELADWVQKKWNNNEIRAGWFGVKEVGGDDEPEIWTPEKVASNEFLFKSTLSKKDRRDIARNGDVERMIKVPIPAFVPSKTSKWSLGSGDKFIILDFTGAFKKDIEDFSKNVCGTRPEEYYDTNEFAQLLNKYWVHSEEANNVKSEFIQKLKEDKKFKDNIKTYITQYILQSISRIKATTKITGSEESIKKTKEDIKKAEASLASMRRLRGEEDIAKAIESGKDFESLDFNVDDKDSSENMIGYFIPLDSEKIARGLTTAINKYLVPALKEGYKDNSITCTYQALLRDDEIFGATINFEFTVGEGLDNVKNPEKLVNKIKNNIIKIKNALSEERAYRSLTYTTKDESIKCYVAYLNGYGKDAYEFKDENILKIVSTFAAGGAEMDESDESIDSIVESMNYDNYGFEIKNDNTVKFIPNSQRYKRQYLLDEWRQEDYFNQYN